MILLCVFSNVFFFFKCVFFLKIFFLYFCGILHFFVK